jgi:hypothetical protein
MVDQDDSVFELDIRAAVVPVIVSAGLVVIIKC